MFIKQLFASIVLLLFTASCRNSLTPQAASDEKAFVRQLDTTVKYYEGGNTLKSIEHSRKLFGMMESISNDSLKVLAYKVRGNCYFLSNNYVSAVGCYIKGIQLAEKKEISFLLPQLYNNLGFNYNKLGFHDKAKKYLESRLKMAQRYDKKAYTFILENLSETYLAIKKPDTALYYADLAKNENTIQGDSCRNKYIQAAIFLDYAMIYALKDKKQPGMEWEGPARRWFEHTIAFNKKYHDMKHLSQSRSAYGAFLCDHIEYDKALEEANAGLLIAQENHYEDIIVSAAELLARVYEKKGGTGDQAKAYTYSRLQIKTAERIRKKNDANAIVEIAVKESRERDRKIFDAREWQFKMQLILIGIALLTAFVIFWMLGRSYIVNEKFIFYTGTLGLLTTFEFLNLTIHSFFHFDTPALMLVIMMISASILVPLHHKLERYVKKQMIENNREVRRKKAKQWLEADQHNN